MSKQGNTSNDTTEMNLANALKYRDRVLEVADVKDRNDQLNVRIMAYAIDRGQSACLAIRIFFRGALRIE